MKPEAKFEQRQSPSRIARHGAETATGDSYGYLRDDRFRKSRYISIIVASIETKMVGMVLQIAQYVPEVTSSCPCLRLIRFNTASTDTIGAAAQASIEALGLPRHQSSLQ